MPESNNKQDSNPQEPNQSAISLSSALLAPVNSIFEAQIHAARAFLNFIFQMGFRHKPDESEIKKMELEPEKHKEKLNEHEEGKKAQKRIDELNKKRQENGELSATEISELSNLLDKYGDLFQQSFSFNDSKGNQFNVNVPNLALLPIRPLSITEAEFSYEFEVTESDKKYEQMPAANKMTDYDPPWFLVKEPKSLRGNFAENTESSSSKNIKVNIKISNTEMPYGLEKLITSLTNSIDVTDKSDVQ